MRNIARVHVTQHQVPPKPRGFPPAHSLAPRTAQVMVPGGSLAAMRTLSGRHVCPACMAHRTTWYVRRTRQCGSMGNLLFKG